MARFVALALFLQQMALVAEGVGADGAFKHHRLRDRLVEDGGCGMCILQRLQEETTKDLLNIWFVILAFLMCWKQKLPLEISMLSTAINSSSRHHKKNTKDLYIQHCNFKKYFQK